MKLLILNSFFVLAILATIITSVTSLNAQDNRLNPAKYHAVESSQALIERGKTKIDNHNYRGAIADLNQSILLNPGLADSYYYRGLARAQLEDQLGAISDFDDAILRNPHHSWAYYQRAGVFFNLGNQSEAILDLQLAAKLFSEQGNTLAYQQAEALLKHFGIKPPPGIR